MRSFALVLSLLLCGVAAKQDASRKFVRTAALDAESMMAMSVSSTGQAVEELEMENDDSIKLSDGLQNMLNDIKDMARSGASPKSDKIQVIKDIVTKELIPDLQATHDAAEEQVGKNEEAIKKCNADMVTRTQKISGSTEVSVGSARTTHATCRKEEAEHKGTKSAKCQELDDFLNGVNNPANLPTPRERDAMVQYVETMSEYYCPLGPRATTLDEACTAATGVHSGHRAKCNKLQASFETAFCTWRTQLIDTCSAQDQCYNSALNLFNDHVKATKTLVKKWKVEYAALKKINCYVDVWLNDKDANTVDANQLKTCEENVVDTSPMDINFPDAPAKAACSLAAVQSHPGTPAFVTTEYADLKDCVEAIACLGTNSVAPTEPTAPTDLGGCTDPTKPTGLVKNGGFDQDMADWDCYHKPGDYIKNDCHAHRNYYGHSITGHLHGYCHHGTQGGIEQKNVATTAGTKYKLKFVAFEGDWDGNDVDSVHVKIDNSDKAEWTTYKVQSPASNEGWKTLTLDFTANGPTTIVMWADKNHCIDVDDIQLLSC